MNEYLALLYEVAGTNTVHCHVTAVPSFIFTCALLGRMGRLILQSWSVYVSQSLSFFYLKLEPRWD